MLKKPWNPPRRTLGEKEGQAARRQWPQPYKSKRGVSAGRGAAGRVGEAGPFLLGKSRRGKSQRPEARDVLQVGPLGHFCSQARAALGVADLPGSKTKVPEPVGWLGCFLGVQDPVFGQAVAGVTMPGRPGTDCTSWPRQEVAVCTAFIPHSCPAARWLLPETIIPVQ